MNHIAARNSPHKCPATLPWMVDFHSTAEGKVFNNQLSAAYAHTYLDHLSKLTPRSKIPPHRLTQLACTMPPDVEQEAVLELLESGMTIAVIKFFDSNRQQVTKIVNTVRLAVENYSKRIGYQTSLAIGLDISQPTIHTITPKQEMRLKQGATVSVSSKLSTERPECRNQLFVNRPIERFVRVGDLIVLGNDAAVSLSAIEVAHDVLKCVVKRAMCVVDRQLPVHLPSTNLLLPPPKLDRIALELAELLTLDFVVVAEHVAEFAKQAISSQTLIVMAKVHSYTNDLRLEQTIDENEAVLVECDVLSMQLHEQTFLVIKSMLAQSLKKGKCVLISINLDNGRPMGRSDLAEVAALISEASVDGIVVPASAPLQSLHTLCRNAEASIYQRQLFHSLTWEMSCPPLEPIYAVCLAAADIAQTSNAAAIIIVTHSGRSARVMSRFRPRCPILTICTFERVARSLSLRRGVVPLMVCKRPSSGDFLADRDMKLQFGITWGKIKGLIRMGDALVLVSGSRADTGFTNTVRVVFASEFDTHEVK